MKKILMLTFLNIMLLASSNVIACPEIIGSWTCTDQNGSTSSMTFELVEGTSDAYVYSYENDTGSGYILLNMGKTEAYSANGNGNGGSSEGTLTCDNKVLTFGYTDEFGGIHEGKPFYFKDAFSAKGSVSATELKLKSESTDLSNAATASPTPSKKDLACTKI